MALLDYHLYLDAEDNWRSIPMSDTPRTDALRKQFECWINATDRFHDEEQAKFWKMVSEMETLLAARGEDAECFQEEAKANASYAVQLREALESANTTLAHIHDRHLPNVDTRDREGERPGPNDDAQTVNDCNEASAVIERALANRPQGTMADEQGDPRIGDTYTAPVPPGYRHDDRCAYRVSVRNHCTCGYVDKEGA